MHRTLTTAVMAATLVVGLTVGAVALTARIGSEDIPRANLDRATNITILDTNNPAAFDGTFDSIDYYAQATGTIRFVVVDTDDIVTWISEAIAITSLGAATLPLAEPAGVTTGSNLGVYTVGTGVIPFDLDPDAADAEWKVNSGEPSVGEDLTPLRDSTDINQNGRYYSMNATVSATSPDLCKNGGWESYDYKNQGQCIASIVAAEQAGLE